MTVRIVGVIPCKCQNFGVFQCQTVSRLSIVYLMYVWMEQKKQGRMVRRTRERGRSRGADRGRSWAGGNKGLGWTGHLL